MIDFTLYGILDPRVVPESSLEHKVTAAARGGVTVVQLRAKTLATEDGIRYGRETRRVTALLGLPLIVNDRVDLALLLGAEGLHVGDQDIPVPDARRLLPPPAVIGATSRTAEAARAREREGADYLGIGPFFASPTKRELVVLEREAILEIRSATDLPLVAIGGIDPIGAIQIGAAGYDGIAVISALWRDDPEQSALQLAEGFKEGRRQWRAAREPNGKAEGGSIESDGS